MPLPTPEEDLRLRRELVPNGIIGRAPTITEDERQRTTAEEFQRLRAVRRSARVKTCALCHHEHHLGKCQSCTCPD